MRTVAYHQVTGITLGEVTHYEKDGHTPAFYARMMTISMEDGSHEDIWLYANDGYALVSKDNEAQQLLKAA